MQQDCPRHLRLGLAALLVAICMTAPGLFANVVHAATVQLSSSEVTSKLSTTLASAKAGDTIVLPAGTYALPDRLSTSTSGQSSKPITIRGAGRDTTIITASGNSFGFRMQGLSNIVLEDFTLKGPYASAGIYLVGCSNITLRRLRVTDSTSQNISAVDAQNIRIEGCDVSGSKSSGIYVYPMDGSWDQVTNNVIINNTSHGNTRQGILAYGKGTQIIGNESWGNGSVSPLDHGIYAMGQDILIENNYLHDHPYGNGIRFGGQDSIIRGNKAVNNARSGVNISGTEDSQRVTVEKNVCMNNGHSGVQIYAETYGPDAITLKENVLIANTQNVTVHSGVRHVSFEGNVLSDPSKSQMRVDMAQSEAAGLLSFSGNSFYGPTCTFQLNGSFLPSSTFLHDFQPGATCQPKAYVAPPAPGNLRMVN